MWDFFYLSKFELKAAISPMPEDMSDMFELEDMRYWGVNGFKHVLHFYILLKEIPSDLIVY